MHHIVEEHVKKYLGDSLGPTPGLIAFIDAVSLTLQHADEIRIALENERATVSQLVLGQAKKIIEDKHILEIVEANMIYGTLYLNRAKEVMFVNDKLKEMIGLTNSATSGILDTFQMRFPSVDIDAAISKCLINHEDSTISDVKSGDAIYQVLFRCLSDKAAELGSLLIFVCDITAQKNEERSRQEFFSIASHELRTPLTAIRGNASMMHDFYSKEMPADMGEMIDDILASSERLIGIVNDFLDVSRLEQKHMVFHFTDFNITPLLSKTVDELQGLAKKKHLSLIADIPSTELIVRADKDRIKQVLINLIANAINYTEVGSVNVSTNIEGGFLKILITDTGVGISEVSQGLLFRKFQQAGDSILTRTTIKGTGLGLYISRLMAIEMGGEVKIEKSTLGVGSVFSVAIPLEKASPILGGESKAAVFLIVEDKDAARMYERMFRLKGYRVEGASDGNKALFLLKEMTTKPVVIVLDALLSSPNGVDMLRALKKDDKLKDIPVSVITNTLEREDEEIFLSLGASLVVTKMNNSMEEVIGRVNEAFRIVDSPSNIN